MLKTPEIEPEIRPEPTRLLVIMGVAVSLLHIWFNVVSVLSSLWQNSLHFAGFALIASLVYPLRKNPTLSWRLMDVLLGLLAASSALYLIA
ncbi:MAG: TRAP transporter permease, partial [Desulfuromonadales bacterium]